MAQLTKPTVAKEKKDVVSFNRRDQRTQILNLNDQFTLEKGVQGKDMYGNKVKGYDTFPQRMQDIESTINGVQLGEYPISECISKLGTLRDSAKYDNMKSLAQIVEGSRN
jgi:hypothetical protein